ncbi:MAG: TonB-dependent receptor [Candidatus Pseudobacter hemicellulosilyticus]|uniref:TonB-dependent receptor n=1 Tax=Candidatus Pseudobacter hemicellulosilyticus TaxID=3121375 RepID=A0AAJ5WR43_9BACT|nr:MAG: TonB-dependent receptor [Pseudobacter sp.]
MKYIHRILSIIVLLCFLVSQAQAQTIQVTGKVTRKSTGEPLAGATISIKGSATAVTSGDNGDYAITLPAAGATLVATYAGLTEVEVLVDKAGMVNFALEEHALTDVVVVGYGSQRRSNVTGSIATIKNKELVSAPVGDLSNALQGRVPGVITKQSSGEPGKDGAAIYIRGNSTFGSSMEPLFVVDGIVRTSRDFAQLDPSEVESINLLKDASAAAIFGVKGANGVVLVTTKRGKAGKMTTSYTFNYGFQRVTKMNDNLGAYEYALLRNEAQFNDGQAATYTSEQIQKFKDGSDPILYPNTDWQDLVLGGTAPQMQHNLNFSGGTDKVKYFASLGYFDQDGLYKSLNYKRYNARINLDMQVTNTTKVLIDLAGRFEDRKAPTMGIEQIFEHTLRNPPTLPAYYPGVGYAEPGSYVNTLRAIDPAAGSNNTQNTTLLTSVSLEQQIPWVKGLSLKGVFAYDRRMNFTKVWNSNVYQYAYNPTNGEYTPSAYAQPNLSETYWQQYQTEMQAHLNYANRFGKHGVSALVLVLQQERPENWFNAARSGFELPYFDVLSMGPVTNPQGAVTEVIGGNKMRSALRSAAARVNYDYNNTYLFQASLRADESEKFAKGYRRGYFPAFSLGWVISNEKFMESIRGTVDYLKLKGSWGKLGSDNMNNQQFLYLSRYVAVANNYPFGGIILPGLEPQAFLPEVTWETSAKTDIGLEARLFNGLIDVEANVFYEHRDKILAVRTAEVPYGYGGPLPAENVGEVKNRGFELVLGHSKRINQDLSYSVRGNITFVKNEIVKAPTSANVPDQFKAVGHSINSYYGYKATGIIRDSATYKNYNKTTQFPYGLGDIMYEDTNDDGVIDSDDRQWLSTGSIPEVVYGIAGGVTYKGFELNFLFQGAARVHQQLTQNAGYAFFNGGRVTGEWLDRWTPDNPGGKLPRLTTNATATTNNYQVPVGPDFGLGGNSFWIQDASYLRLKNLEIAYNFRQPFITNAGISNLRVFATGQNLLTFTKLNNQDPENTDARGWYYPAQTVFNFGVNVQF